MGRWRRRSVSARSSVSAVVPDSKPKEEEAAAASGGVVERVGKAATASSVNAYEVYAPEKVKEEVKVLSRWWSRERLGRKVDVTWVGMREVDRVVLDVLTSLVCASLTEDTYGVVQRDIPKIIEAIVSFLFAVEEAQAELIKDLPEVAAESEEERLEREKGSEAVSYVGDALKDSLARIVRTFGDKLTAFRFPPRVAGKVQGFMDFCATV
ncbi:hypothetical protein H1R20_g2841, partial [Candolleomyces eurysporus]